MYTDPVYSLRRTPMPPACKKNSYRLIPHAPKIIERAVCSTIHEKPRKFRTSPPPLPKTPSISKSQNFHSTPPKLHTKHIQTSFSGRDSSMPSPPSGGGGGMLLSTPRTIQQDFKSGSARFVHALLSSLPPRKNRFRARDESARGGGGGSQRG